MNFKKLGECTPTSCPKAGIKIHHSDNDYRINPLINGQIKQSKLTKPISFQNTTLNSLDLDLDDIIEACELTLATYKRIREKLQVVDKSTV